MALIVYVDESGQPHQLDEGPYVIASVAIDEDRLPQVISAIENFVAGIRRSYGIDVDEIHTKNLVKGNREWYGVSIDTRRKIFEDFAQLVSNLDIVLNIVVVKRGLGVRIASPEGIRSHAMKLLIERIFMTPSRYPIAILVFDSSTIGQDANIRSEVEKAVRESLAHRSYRVYVSFKDSIEEPAIQIADFVAYIVRSIKMHQYSWRGFNFEKAFLLFENRIRRCPGQDTYEGCGLKEWIIDR